MPQHTHDTHTYSIKRWHRWRSADSWSTHTQCYNVM